MSKRPSLTRRPTYKVDHKRLRQVLQDLSMPEENPVYPDLPEAPPLPRGKDDVVVEMFVGAEDGPDVAKMREVPRKTLRRARGSTRPKVRG
jgi:hypothetical protein